MEARTAPKEKKQRKLYKFDAAVGDAVINCIKVGAFVETAAIAAGISKRTYYNWLRRSKDPNASEPLKAWGKEIRKAFSQSEVFCLTVISSAAKSNVWQAAAWLLERRIPERYARKEKLEHSGGIDGQQTKTTLVLPTNGRDVDEDGEPLPVEPAPVTSDAPPND